MSSFALKRKLLCIACLFWIGFISFLHDLLTQSGEAACPDFSSGSNRLLVRFWQVWGSWSWSGRLFGSFRRSYFTFHASLTWANSWGGCITSWRSGCMAFWDFSRSHGVVGRLLTSCTDDWMLRSSRRAFSSLRSRLLLRLRCGRFGLPGRHGSFRLSRLSPICQLLPRLCRFCIRICHILLVENGLAL